MKELSLNILDIAENSVKAGASLTEILVLESGDILTLTITDNGSGMTKEILNSVTDPFCTTRTTRKVGLGIPFFKEAAEQTGGSFSIASVEKQVDSQNCGTRVTAVFKTDSIDFTPIGDIVSTIITLIHGSPEVDLVFLHQTEKGSVSIDTREMREVLGNDVPLNSFEVIEYIRNSLETEYELIK